MRCARCWSERWSCAPTLCREPFALGLAREAVGTTGTVLANMAAHSLHSEYHRQAGADLPEPFVLAVKLFRELEADDLMVRNGQRWGRGRSWGRHSGLRWLFDDRDTQVPHHNVDALFGTARLQFLRSRSLDDRLSVLLGGLTMSRLGLNRALHVLAARQDVVPELHNAEVIMRAAFPEDGVATWASLMLEDDRR